MKIKFKKFNRKGLKKAGMGLVEVVVAIGISVVTLTGAAVFSSNLSIRAQENFVEVSILQLQSLVTEQIRLIESELKREAAEFKNNGDTSTRVFAPIFTKTGTSTTGWDTFCTQSAQSLAMSLPNFTSNNNITLSNATGASVKVPTDDGANYIFTPLDTTEKFGSFDNMSVSLGINKTIPNVSSTGSPFEKVISFKTVVSYRIFGKTYFTKPEEIRILGYLTCK